MAVTMGNSKIYDCRAATMCCIHKMGSLHCHCTRGGARKFLKGGAIAPSTPPLASPLKCILIGMYK